MKLAIAAAVLLTLWTTDCALAGNGQAAENLSDILVNTFRYNTRTPNIVDVRELKTSCPRRDCISSIDNPDFIDVLNARFLADDDLLMVITHNGISHAYPYKILNIHEIVNDYFGDTPVVVSYSPLCASGAAYVSQVNGLPTEFGVSGMLHNNNRVIYDRRYNNLWGQIRGEAIVGQNAGDKLTRVPVKTISWASLKTHHPNARILKPSASDEARLMAAGDQYRNYKNSNRLYYPVSAKDARAHPKELVYGIELNGDALAITDKYLQEKRSVTRAIGGNVIEIRFDDNGTLTARNVTARDTDSHTEIAVTRLFWFAWFTFYTNTDLMNLN